MQKEKLFNLLLLEIDIYVIVISERKVNPFFPITSLITFYRNKAFVSVHVCDSFLELLFVKVFDVATFLGTFCVYIQQTF